MAGNLKVTPEQLNALSSQMIKTSGDVHGMHQALKGQLAPLFGADWVGTASGQFQQLYEQFDKNATGLTQALEGIAKLLSAASTSYAEAESQIARTFSAQ
jgi:WXG100 family type VII secretion target